MRRWTSWRFRLKSWGWVIRIAGYTAILDACVLYPAPLRDILLEVAASGIYRARWSADIQDEWIRALLNKRPELDPIKLARTRDLMETSILGAVVTGYEDLIPNLTLPDPNDAHVLAAAIVAGADAIVTFNQKHFPDEAVGKYEIEVLHPDEFLFQQYGLDAAAVVLAARRCRARLSKPTVGPEDYLLNLRMQALPLLVSELSDYTDLI